MDSQSSKAFIKELANKYNLSESIVSDIVYSQFEFCADVIKNGDREKMDFKIVLLPRLGKFIVKQNSIKKALKRTQEIKDGIIYHRRRDNKDTTTSTDNTGV